MFVFFFLFAALVGAHDEDWLGKLMFSQDESILQRESAAREENVVRIHIYTGTLNEYDSILERMIAEKLPWRQDPAPRGWIGNTEHLALNAGSMLEYTCALMSTIVRAWAAVPDHSPNATTAARALTMLVNRMQARREVEWEAIKDGTHTADLIASGLSTLIRPLLVLGVLQVIAMDALYDYDDGGFVQETMCGIADPHWWTVQTDYAYLCSPRYVSIWSSVPRYIHPK